MFAAVWDNDEIWFFTCVADEGAAAKNCWPSSSFLLRSVHALKTARFNYVVATTCTLSHLFCVMLFCLLGFLTRKFLFFSIQIQNSLSADGLGGNLYWLNKYIGFFSQWELAQLAHLSQLAHLAHLAPLAQLTQQAYNFFILFKCENLKYVEIHDLLFHCL